MLRLLLCSFLLFSAATQLAGQPQGPATHIITALTLPLRCSPNSGDIFNIPSTGFYRCDTTNHWTLFTTSSGGATNPGCTFVAATTCSITLTGVVNKAVASCWDNSSTLVQIIPNDYAGSTADTLVVNFSAAQTGYCNAVTGIGLTGATGATGAAGAAGPISATGGSGTELQYRAGATTLGALTGSSVSGADVTLGGNLSVGTTLSVDNSTGITSIGANPDPDGWAFGKRLNVIQYSTSNLVADSFTTVAALILEPTADVAATLYPYEFYTELQGTHNFLSAAGLGSFVDFNSVGSIGSMVAFDGEASANSGTVTGAYTGGGVVGVRGSPRNNGATVAALIGLEGVLSASAGTTAAGYTFLALHPDGATGIASLFQFYTPAVGGTSGLDYDFWADEQGVFRIRADNTFDSVYQAIPALYNPQFTKYTPGASNYERIVEQWDGNVAEFGTEKGGTGTLRPLRFIGPSVEAVSYKTNTNCANAASPAVCAAAAAGAVAIPTGITTVSLVVNTTAVTASSQIKLQADDSLTIAATTCNNTLATLVGGLAVTARTPGTSFTITYNGTIATNPLCVAYTILN